MFKINSSLGARDPELDAIIQHLRASGIATVADLARAIGRSQPSVSRRLRELVDRVAVLGRGRAALATVLPRRSRGSHPFSRFSGPTRRVASSRSAPSNI
ncbi:MAG: winged helix-turn-helix transcriptional regulator [Betaproteobacteria bacterium]|nr:winged helix-turn-helix transcriptional regulator [Betaproteobacteria bacterium]